MTIRLLLTAGPTREPIDPVRFLSNASTGRQAIALAEEALSRSWQVEMVHGPLEASPPSGVSPHPVTTAEEMFRACARLHSTCDVLIGAAAVSDYRLAEPFTRKHKGKGQPWTIELVPTRDILEELGRRKGGRIHVGFALETEDLIDNARLKLESKNLDLIVANPSETIGASSGRYVLIDHEGHLRELGALEKRELARTLCEEIARRLQA